MCSQVPGPPDAPPSHPLGKAPCRQQSPLQLGRPRGLDSVTNEPLACPEEKQSKKERKGSSAMASGVPSYGYRSVCVRSPVTTCIFLSCPPSHSFSTVLQPDNCLLMFHGMRARSWRWGGESPESHMFVGGSQDQPRKAVPRIHACAL